MAWVGPEMSGARSQEITREGQTVLAKVMKVQIWQPPGGTVGTVLIRGTMAPVSTAVREKAAPVVLAWIPDNSVSPHLSVTSELLP